MGSMGIMGSIGSMGSMGSMGRMGFCLVGFPDVSLYFLWVSVGFLLVSLMFA